MTAEIESGAEIDRCDNRQRHSRIIIRSRRHNRSFSPSDGDGQTPGQDDGTSGELVAWGVV